MEPLFTADIIVNGQNEYFDVRFHDEAYHFESEAGRNFSIRRTDDTWVVNGALAEIAQQQAISALDHYLLSQH